MILLEREDVMRIGLESHPAFLVEWEVGSPEALAADYADVLADGPFLLVVTDECAWAGPQSNRLKSVAEKRLDLQNSRCWKYLAELYAAKMGISPQSMILRYVSMTRQVRRAPGQWFPWEAVYRWPEGGDLAWSALLFGQHSWLHIREYNGRRQVRATR